MEGCSLAHLAMDMTMRLWTVANLFIVLYVTNDVK